MPVLQRPTVTLAYQDRGNGPPLVFLHGWCDSSTSWESTVEEFSGTYRCVTPDMRGHGASGLPRDHAYFPEALSNDVVAICEAAGVTRPVLVGHSFGGFLAATVAMRFPGFAAGIVVVDQLVALHDFAVQMRGAEGLIRSPETHMVFRSGLFDTMVSPLMGDDGRALVEAAKRAAPVEVGQALWAALFEYSLDEIDAMGERLMRAFANQPSLTVEASPQPAYHERLRSLAPKARAAVIEGGHWIHLERPNEFRAELRRFLSGALP
jgi:pimeloyl-ACP methyl ester carboxylesterase